MKNNNLTNIVWHDMSISREDREKLLKQKGLVLWFTGLSGSGKSTVASALEKELFNLGKLTYLLDGDNVRHGLNSDLGFSIEDRQENIRRIKELATLFVDAGIITITTFISPLREDRDSVRKLLDDKFIEVYVDCSVEACEKRDPKGLYKKARAGEIKNFTGIDSPYEKPSNPEIIISTENQSIEECVETILKYIQKF